MRVFLCEKPSQGKDIARVLGARQRGNGCYSGSGITVTWCIGHLVEAAPPETYGEQYKQWNAAFDAGQAAALGTPMITLHPPEHDHALKEVDRAALAVCREPEQVVAILRYVLNGEL